jgi:hypothetical protein
LPWYLFACEEFGWEFGLEFAVEFAVAFAKEFAEFVSVLDHSNVIP